MEDEVNTPKGEEPNKNLAPLFQASAGMEAVQNGVSFTNQEVLSPVCNPMKASGKILADQAAGMMMQDVTSFSQGIMQIMTAAIAKATAEVVATDGQKGKEALATLSPALAKLPSFISLMASSAQTIEEAFCGKEKTKGEDDGAKTGKKSIFGN